MPALDAILQEKLDQLESRAQKRTLWPTSRNGIEVKKHDKPLISFSCNDYLGLSRHPKVVAAAQEALQQYGAGAGASRLVTGNNPLYGDLEIALAEHKKTEAACVFGSGYLANIGTIPALVGEGDLILADKYSHACMLDGAKLSGAKLLRFAHNDAGHLRALLEKHRGDYNRCLIMTETVFSMDGDTAPLAALQEVAEGFDCWLLTDDAHGLGVFKDKEERPVGRHSLERTSCEVQQHFAQAKQNVIQMGTLSKAAGCYGGYVCGSATLVEYIKSTARSLIYSTALPPAALAASIAALHVMQNEPEHTQRAKDNAAYFASLMGMSPAQGTIVPVVVGAEEKALELSAYLEAEGFLVVAIRPPTVPQNTARLRFAFSAQHTREHIDTVVGLLKSRGIPCAS